MCPIITAFRASPDEGQGLARDMRVRWALEEVGRAYEVRFGSFREMKEPAHRRLHPFGQIPTYEEGDVMLFESGAIVLHIAQHYEGLLPSDPGAQAHAIAWMFAALNTVEPPVVEREQVSYLERDRNWYTERLPLLDDRIRHRLDDFSLQLGCREWLLEDFTAGDLMMVMVLRRLEGTDILEEYSNLSSYVARGKARPAYKRAFEDQMAVFKSSLLER
jgi:glutathione S-transferase